MNYLAHLHLATIASDDPGYLVGGMMGDFVKGPISADYPLAIRAGVKLHRRIDRFTDEHASVRDARRLFRPPLRRYAGIVLDISFDHFLSRHWQSWASEELDTFAGSAFDQLHAHFEHLPDRLQRALPRMQEHQLFTSYQSLSGLDVAFTRVARRLSRGAPLRNAIASVERNYDAIEAHFLALYPDLVELALHERGITHEGH